MKYTVKPHKDTISSRYGALILIVAILAVLGIDKITF